ncbi:MAG TPA: hypothetical protein VF538_01635 [Pyrinomonadaceae bacterium]|jgi:hypothetical protein
MFELYFIFYRVPKMMSALAKERGRSALAWSLMGIGAWLGAEFVVMFGVGIIYGLGSILLGWEPELPAGVRLLAYVLALAAAFGCFTLVRRSLYAKSPSYSGPQDRFATPPPPPPEFK